MGSNALETSILRARLPPKDFLSRTFTALEAKAIQSLIFLPLTKPLCSLDIIDGRITDNLSARTLGII